MTRTKRLFDVMVAGLGLTVLAVPLAIVALVIRLSSRGPVFFRHIRVGQLGRPFRIFKFRTMINKPSRTCEITVGDDDRTTWIGRILRRSKIDELPQLINVLVGDMSLVGPRPEMPKFVEIYSEEDKRIVLSVPPGLTDFASLRFRRENEILAAQPDPLDYYERVVIPIKLRYCRFYVRRANLRLDIYLISLTIICLIKDALPRRETSTTAKNCEDSHPSEGTEVAHGARSR